MNISLIKVPAAQCTMQLDIAGASYIIAEKASYTLLTCSLSRIHSSSE